MHIKRVCVLAIITSTLRAAETQDYGSLLRKLEKLSVSERNACRLSTLSTAEQRALLKKRRENIEDIIFFSPTGTPESVERLGIYPPSVTTDDGIRKGVHIFLTTAVIPDYHLRRGLSRSELRKYNGILRALRNRHEYAGFPHLDMSMVVYLTRQIDAAEGRRSTARRERSTEIAQRLLNRFFQQQKKFSFRYMYPTEYGNDRDAVRIADEIMGHIIKKDNESDHNGYDELFNETLFEKIFPNEDDIDVWDLPYDGFHRWEYSLGIAIPLIDERLQLQGMKSVRATLKDVAREHGYHVEELRYKWLRDVRRED